MKHFALIVLSLTLVVGCQKNKPGGAVTDPLDMETPLDTYTSSPSPLYEPKTPQEKAAAREASEQATAAKRAAEEANLTWAEGNCRLQTFHIHSPFFEVVSESPICLVKTVGNCPHGVTVISTKQTSHIEHSVESTSKPNEVFFSQRGDKTIRLIADDNDGSVVVYIEEVRIWTTSPQ